MSLPAVPQVQGNGTGQPFWFLVMQWISTTVSVGRGSGRGWPLGFRIGRSTTFGG
ncbi:hypothetical protein [Methylorubrum populi]|uniref:hypothetical protein n=1 Tax=Methylorubrum populi TaxID=223967 RepID=UPI0013901ACA|nr:hypothetical protein [Methylorubrum populi]